MTFEFQPAPAGLLDEIGAMLRTGEINRGDRRHAEMLLADPQHLQKSNVRWLESLLARGGASFAGNPQD